jgi:hypothetical protein
LAINAKGGENIKPKAKGLHHQISKKKSQMVVFQLVYKLTIDLSICIFKIQFSIVIYVSLDL